MDISKSSNWESKLALPIDHKNNTYKKTMVKKTKRSYMAYHRWPYYYGLSLVKYVVMTSGLCRRFHPI